ncbi:MAG: TIM-barrel domain-containing protein [Candidatus Korobacteraceae bacterium]
MTAGCRLDIALPPAISIADTPQKAHCPRKCTIARRVVEIPAALTVAAWAVCCLPIAAQTASASARAAVLKSDGIQFSMELAGGRYGFDADGSTVIAADPEAGVLLAGRPVNLRPDGPCANTECHLAGATAVGEYMRLTVKLAPHRAELIAEPQQHGEEVRFVTGGAEPAFGLADHAVLMNFSTLAHKQYNTDVSGFADDQFLSGQGLARLVSNFVIYPRQRFAEIFLDPTMKIVHTSEKQIVQGVVHAGPSERLFYFFGNPHEIYAQYLELRNETGYRVFMPKYQAFGVGWEAFGALGWNTNQNTVEASVDRYIAAGYPLRWIVIGSGFWPAAPAMSATTSFGFWNREKYPDPTALVRHFRDEHLAVMLGLRITFITTGPYSAEGAVKGYFLKKDGEPEIFHGSWPKLPYYLLDAHNPAALNWYMGLVKRWQAFGIDGWKEDFYGYDKYDLRDDKVDPVNDRLMEEHQLVIERNGYLSSNGDLQRINDFNYDRDQDRGPVNALAFAYSGFPLVYPDIVGGTFGENGFSTIRSPRMQIYMMRNVQWAALHSSMGMGEPPWSFSAQVAKVMLQAAQLHARIAPYIYSNARRFARDGYPWTMTPLPIAFPDDPIVYGRENSTVRGYEWMIGDALLATPLYGNDYATATWRDIYLPAGEWMDFDTGKLYRGNRTLTNFALPVGKTPLFIGGSGVTLEDRGGKVLLCVYPVATHASVDLTLPEGGKPVHVEVNGLSADARWAGVRVQDSDGHAVAVQKQDQAFTFTPQPGAAYRVRALDDGSR